MDAPAARGGEGGSRFARGWWARPAARVGRGRLRRAEERDDGGTAFGAWLGALGYQRARHRHPRPAAGGSPIPRHQRVASRPPQAVPFIPRRRRAHPIRPSRLTIPPAEGGVHLHLHLPFLRATQLHRAPPHQPSAIRAASWQPSQASSGTRGAAHALFSPLVQTAKGSFALTSRWDLRRAPKPLRRRHFGPAPAGAPRSGLGREGPKPTAGQLTNESVMPRRSSRAYRRRRAQPLRELADVVVAGCQKLI